MDARSQQQYAETFHSLHRKGDPLVLLNAWDVATAKAIAKTAPAIATSSGAVAAALGYADGEHAPFDIVLGLVARMSAAVSVPVSIDLEAGYGDTPDAAARSATEIQLTPLPVNIMVMKGVPQIHDLARVGVRRVSLGPWPMMAAMRVIGQAAAVVTVSKQYGTFLRPSGGAGAEH
jgi:2-methylisocitrate lyase-like PEP mutase family enzyme